MLDANSASESVGTRVRQVRGAICEGDNFHPATTTYAQHPLTKQMPANRTWTALQANRKRMFAQHEQDKNEFRKMKQKNEG